MARGLLCRGCGQVHDPMLSRCPPVKPLGRMEMHVAPEVYAALADNNVTRSVTKTAGVTKSRGRPKRHASNAAKQRAYRKRKSA